MAHQWLTLRRIAELYKVEANIRGVDPGQRLSARQARTAPLVAAFGDWLQEQRLRVSAKSVRRESRPLDAFPILLTVEKLAYIHRHWDGLQTVTRLAETVYLLVVPAATVTRDMAWLRRQARDAAVAILDVTASEAAFPLMGPKARDVLAACSPDDFSNAAHPFGIAREIEVGMGLARAHRVSYAGELGWELYVSADQAAHVWEAIMAAGAEHGLRLCGIHAMNSCRLEKAFRHYGHDITDEDHVLEAGLGFAVKADKNADFIGRDAVLRKRDAGLRRRLIQLRLEDPDAHLHHGEPLLRDGKIVGFLTSGAYGHALGGPVGMGYVPYTRPGEPATDMLASTYEIEVAGRRLPAQASLKPMYDEKSERMRA